MTFLGEGVLPQNKPEACQSQGFPDSLPPLYSLVA